MNSKQMTIINYFNKNYFFIMLFNLYFCAQPCHLSKLCRSYMNYENSNNCKKKPICK